MSYTKNSPRYTRLQARAKRQTMDDGIEPGDSISQVKETQSCIQRLPYDTFRFISRVRQKQRATGSRYKYTGNQDEFTREKSSAEEE